MFKSHASSLEWWAHNPQVRGSKPLSDTFLVTFTVEVASIFICGMQVCPRGHYCKKGSSQPRRCPPLVACPEGTEVPDRGFSQHVAAAVMVCALMACLVALWQGMAWHNRRVCASSAELLDEYQLTPTNEQVRLAFNMETLETMYIFLSYLVIYGLAALPDIL